MRRTIQDRTATSPTAATSEAVRLRLDDRTLVGTLETPARRPGEQAPAAIVLHGLLDHRDSPVPRAVSRALVAAGVTVLRFDFNGHGRSGGRPVDMTVPREIEDTAAAFDLVRGLEGVSRIGLVGHSQGGVVAGMLAGRLGDRLSALVLLAPGASLQHDVTVGRFLGARFDPVHPPESVRVWGYPIGREYIRTAQRLPVFETSAGYRGPVSIVLGTADEVVPVDVARRYDEIYAAAELQLLPGQDHGFTRDVREPAALATDFLLHHLR